MALNFPNNPEIGQVFIAEGASFTWTGRVWVQTGGVSATEGIPVGAVMFFAANKVPAGWLVCANQPVTEIYPDLRDYLLAAGSPYGALDGDPRVPDLRGEFIRGFDGGRGVDVGRVFGSSQGDAIRNITGTFATAHGLHPFAPGGITGAFAPRANRGNTASGISAGDWTDGATFDASRVVPTAPENRPRNVALLPCIKAFAALVVEGIANFALATPAQALAGKSADTLMTPALVRAVSGDVIIARSLLAGTNFGVFVPPEFDAVDLEWEGLLPLTSGTIGVIRVGTGPEGVPVWLSTAQYNQSVLFQSGGPANGINNIQTGFSATVDARIASGGVGCGKFSLRRLNDGSTVYVNGQYRGASEGVSGSFQSVQVDGFMFFGTGPYTHVGLFSVSGAGFSTGTVTVRGRRKWL